LDKIHESEGVYLEEPIHPKEIRSNHVDLVDLKKRVRYRTGKETIATRHICPPEHLLLLSIFLAHANGYDNREGPRMQRIGGERCRCTNYTMETVRKGDLVMPTICKTMQGGKVGRAKGRVHPAVADASALLVSTANQEES
jgi:hypothetical protein